MPAWLTIFFFLLNDYISVTINICKSINQGFYSFVAILLHSVVNFESCECFSIAETWKFCFRSRKIS